MPARPSPLLGARAWVNRTGDPRPESDREFALTLSQTVGGQASGGMGALLERETLTGLGAGEDADGAAQRVLQLKMGYGIGLRRGQLTATPEAGLAVADGHRELRLGAQLGLARTGPTTMTIDLSGTRRESTGTPGEVDHALILQAQMRW